MEQSLEFNNEIRSAADDQFSFKDYMDQCPAKWKWFVASVVVISLHRMLYILRQQPEYSRSMQVLIKDQDMGGGADILQRVLIDGTCGLEHQCQQRNDSPAVARSDVRGWHSVSILT